MEINMTKTAADYPYAHFVKGEPTDYRDINGNSFKEDMLANMDCGTLSKHDFVQFAAFCQYAHQADGSYCDFAMGNMSLDELKKDMQCLRNAASMLPVLSAENGVILLPLNLENFSIGVGNDEATLEKYQAMHGTVTDGKPDDKELYAFAGLAAGYSYFTDTVMDTVIMPYLEQVDKQCHTTFAKDLEDWTGLDINQRVLNADGKLEMSGYEFYDALCHHPAAASFQLEDPAQNLKFDADLVTNPSFDIPLDMERIEGILYPERKVVEEEVTVEQNLTEEREESEHATNNVVPLPFLRNGNETKSEMKQTGEKKKVIRLSNGKVIEDKENETAKNLQMGDMLEHKVYGRGIFLRRTEKGYLEIKFDSEKEPKILTDKAFTLNLLKMYDPKEHADEQVNAESVKKEKQEAKEPVISGAALETLGSSVPEVKPSVREARIRIPINRIIEKENNLFSRQSRFLSIRMEKGKFEGYEFNVPAYTAQYEKTKDGMMLNAEIPSNWQYIVFRAPDQHKGGVPVKVEEALELIANDMRPSGLKKSAVMTAGKENLFDR